MILSLIDRYITTPFIPSTYLASVTPFAPAITSDKRRVVTQLIRKHKPKVIIDAGSQCYYSTLLFSRAQKKAGAEYPSNYSSIRSPFAQDVKRLMEFADLKDQLEVMNGEALSIIHHLHDRGELRHIDMLLLHPDHIGGLFLCKCLNLIREGTVIIADRIYVEPTNSWYLSWVRSSVAAKRERLSDPDPDRVRVTLGRGEDDFIDYKLNPNWKYESGYMWTSMETAGRPPVSILLL